VNGPFIGGLVADLLERLIGHFLGYGRLCMFNLVLFKDRVVLLFLCAFYFVYGNQIALVGSSAELL
jgi:hypothetical protein